DGITLSGGEPFQQPAACAELARRAHAKGLNVWTFTGYLYEKLLEKAEADSAVAELLRQTDVLVDGPFLLAERSLELLYKGSKNQRTIDLNKTREEGRIVLYTQPEW
ncbi:MAG: radical SAM protein, partial [Clostridia bacterium]|nr:radical SAM protein [Clostridia bacterium]